jgi:hypothetical protein
MAFGGRFDVTGLIPADQKFCFGAILELYFMSEILT